MKQKIKRLARFLVGRDWYPSLDVEVTTLTIGNPGACWTVAIDYLHSDSIVYCVGIGEDISFDIGLAKRLGAGIHAFDPTPKSLAWIRSQQLPTHYTVHEYGLAAEDGMVSFSPPANPEHVSHRIVNSNDAGSSLVSCPVKRFETILRTLGHDHVDLLKMDIEGAEYAVIQDLASLESLPQQLLVEFHHRQVGFDLADTKSAVRTLRSIGYQLFHVSENGEEYAFLMQNKQKI